MTTEKQNSFTYEDLIKSGKGELFGPDNARLPAPPMLMMDRIVTINNDGGEFGKGEIIAAAVNRNYTVINYYSTCCTTNIQYTCASIIWSLETFKTRQIQSFQPLFSPISLP